MNSSRHFMSVSFACAVIVGLATGNVLLSQAHAATREQQTAACKGDALKFCTFDIPNEKKIASCLQAKREKLSPACKAMFPEKKSSAKKKPK